LNFQENKHLFKDSSIRCFNSKLNIQNSKDIFKKKGTHSVLIKNECSYFIQVLVFENKSNSKEILEKMIEIGEQISFEMNEDDVILLLPGKEKGKISSNIQIPFCKIDEYFEQMFLTPLKLKKKAHKEVKLMLNESERHAVKFAVIDIYDSFESL
jgi:hypothetical protein